MGAPQLSPKNGGHKISSPSRESFNPLHPSIDRNILHSVLNTFHMVLTGTIFNSQELLYLVIISFFLMIFI